MAIRINPDDEYDRMLAWRELGSALTTLWLDHPPARPWMVAGAWVAALMIAKEFDDRHA